MKAVVWHGPHDVRVDDVADPVIQKPTDMLIRVTTTAICGTDLHPYHGQLPDFRPGTILGHEFVGEVVELGEHVHNFTKRDRVVCTDIIADGTCWYCRRGDHWHCPNRTLFGYGPLFGEDTPGGQAEYVRVPYADIVAYKIPDGVPDEKILFVSDILPTGYVCALHGGIQQGDTVAVVGCGPVGLMAQLCAQLFGPAQVLAIDRIASRLELAARLGSIPVNASEVDPVARVKEMTGGRGADVVLEAVGGEAALNLALSLARGKGTVSSVGVHLLPAFTWNVLDAFLRELTVRFGIGDAMRYRERLVPLIESGRLDPSVIISHRLPLADAPKDYELFDKKEAQKVVMRP